MTPRLSGKSLLTKLAIEHALNEGKTVVVATPEGSTKRKRYGHLTSITPLRKMTPNKTPA